MLLYAVIARSNDGTILAETTAAGIEGNHPQVTQQLIQGLVGNPTLVSQGNRKTFAHVGQSLSTWSAEEEEKNQSSSSGNYDDYYEGGQAKYWGMGQQQQQQKSVANSSDSEQLETYFHVQRGESLYYICLSDDRDSRRQRG